jgi:nucleotide-binding universal stress UspA family protein
MNGATIAGTPIGPEGGPGFGRILVGVDGREGGRDALSLTRVVATAVDASVLAITVIPYGPFPVGFVALGGEDLAGEAGLPFDQAREVLGDLRLETRAYGGGSPSWVMSEYAERGEVDLVVVGSPHHGRLGRVFLGSVATSLLHGAACPVAVAPRGFAASDHSFGIRLIAIAYDGTAESMIALRHAEALALRTGASLRLLTVVSPARASAIPGSAGYVPAVPPQPEKVLAEGIAAVGGAVRADGQRLDGRPAAALAAACSEDVDLIVVGSRGYGPALRVVLGSVSSELSRTSPCPVLVTQRGG